MHTCFNCGRSDHEFPLIPLNFRGEALAICPQCLPVLIHKPVTLTEKLPGAVVPPSTDHD